MDCCMLRIILLDYWNTSEFNAVTDLGGFQRFQLKPPLSWISKFITYINSQLAELARNLDHKVLISHAQKMTMSTDPFLFGEEEQNLW